MPRATLTKRATAALSMRDKMIKAIGLKGHGKTTFNAKATIGLLQMAREAALKYPNVAQLASDKAEFTTVCGDVHGQGRDFLRIFELFGQPALDRPYLFNGDLVDRGPNGAEIVLILASHMVETPGAVVVNRGNHELPQVFEQYGFTTELAEKFGNDAAPVTEAFVGFFNALPVASIVDKRIFVVHGGVPHKRDISVKEIDELQRDVAQPHRTIDQMLWSDPTGSPCSRGAVYNAYDTQKFLKAVGCEFLLRSHEVEQEGFQMHVGGLGATLFSAPNYCGTYSNKGAVARVKHGAVGTLPEFIQFTAAPAGKVARAAAAAVA